jgi:hypothetical protein
MLDSHPSLAIPGESNFIRYRWAERRAYGSKDHFQPQRLLEDILADENFRRWGIAADDVRDLVRQIRSPGFADVVAAPFQAYAKCHGKSRWGDKTPIYVLSIPAIAGLFPDAKFVHLIRDGRDVALSYLGMPRFDGRILHAAWRWRDWVTAGVRSGSGLGAERYIEVRYEELVEQPETELRRLCTYLGMEFDERMLSFYLDADVRLQAPPEMVPFHRNTLMPSHRSARDWRVQMTPPDVEVFEAVAGELLEQLGYERWVQHVPLETRALVAAKTTLRRAHVAGSRFKKQAVRSSRRLARAEPARSAS